MKNEKALENESIKNNSTIIIPKELQNLKSFVCYDKAKRPINPITGVLTSVTNKVNRWDYQTALNGADKFQNVSGIGVILGYTPKGILSGLDIDNCINDNGVMASEAQELIRQLDTYTELSPSSKGIHCLFFAEKIGNRCKTIHLDWCKCLELYSKDRYFTLTGNCINNKPIEQRQTESNGIYKKFFEIKANPKSAYMTIAIASSDFEKDERKLIKGLSQGGKLKNIYEGNRPKLDESSNDLIFCNLLKIWSNGNKALMKKTFINSPYFLSKDDGHKRKILERTDYLDRTISRALDERGLYGKL